MKQQQKNDNTLKDTFFWKNYKPYESQILGTKLFCPGNLTQLLKISNFWVKKQLNNLNSKFLSKKITSKTTRMHLLRDFRAWQIESRMAT